MRFVFLNIFFLISFSVFSQSGQISGRLTLGSELKDIYGFQYFLIQLKKNDSVVKETFADSTGHFELKNFKTGFYSLTIHQIGNRDGIMDSLLISGDTTINLTYPAKCKYVYTRGWKPRCIGGHTDSIIPISYGFPTKKTMERAKRGLVRLGGCMVTGCDPHYYCTIHKREL